MRTSGWGLVLVRVAVTLVLALPGASAIVAADGGDPAVIYACVKKTGEVTIPGPSETCRQTETTLRRSTEGGTGETGLPGTAGRRAIAEELIGLPCATPGGPLGLILEVPSYGRSGSPTLLCLVSGWRFIDHGDQTITDTQTGLMWEKKVAGGNWGNTCLTEPHGVGSACTWDQAMDDWLDLLNGWCDSCAGKGGFAGYTDWRLPTVAELLTILDTSRVPAINPAFGETEAREYLTASSDDAGPPAAVAVNFYNGGAIEVSKSYPTRVRAVRGGP